MDELQGLLDRLGRLGVPPEEVLQASRIGEIQQGCLGIPARVLQAQRVLDTVSRIGPSDLGFQLATQWTLHDYGPFSAWMRSCENLLQMSRALKEFTLRERNFHLFADRRVSGEWRIEHVTRTPFGPGARLLLEELVARTKLETEAYLGRPVTFTRVELSYPAPPHKRRYEELFQCRVLFDQRRNVLSLDEECLLHPLATQAAEAADVDPALEGETAPGEITACDRIRAAILAVLLFSPGSYPSMKRIAADFEVSQSSIKRALAGEGANFRWLVDEVRRRHAAEHLAFTSTAPKEIAHRLGFTNVNNFRRAFRRWMGLTPAEFREVVGDLLQAASAGETLH